MNSLTAENIEPTSTLDRIRTRQSFWPIAAPAPSDEEMDEALLLALNAPDYGQLHPTRFLKISGDKLGDLGALFVKAASLREPGKDHDHWHAKAQAAPAMVVVIARLDEKHPKVTIAEQTISVGAAGMNVLNALHLQGYSGYWTTGVNASDDTVDAAFGLAENEVIAGFIFVGTPREGARLKDRKVPDGFIQQWGGLKNPGEIQK
jgi:nitroreductase